MKKLLAVIVMAFAFAACGPIPTADAQTTTTEPEVECQALDCYQPETPVDVGTATVETRPTYPIAPDPVVVAVVVEPRFTG